MDAAKLFDEYTALGKRLFSLQVERDRLMAGMSAEEAALREVHKQIKEIMPRYGRLERMSALLREELKGLSG